MKKNLFWLTACILIAIAGSIFAAIQGDFVLNFQDASTSTKFYRATGDVTNGLDVDVTRVQSTVTITGVVSGNATPSDSYANPTNAINTQAFSLVWNGSTWDRWANQTMAGDGVSSTTIAAGKVVSFPIYYNGSTWDRTRGNLTDGMQTYSGRVSAATVSLITPSTASITLSAASTTRRMVTLFYEGSGSLYVKFGSTAATNSYTVKMAPESYYELPKEATYSGIITAISSTSTGTVMVTNY